MKLYKYFGNADWHLLMLNKNTIETEPASSIYKTKIDLAGMNRGNFDTLLIRFTAAINNNLMSAQHITLAINILDKFLDSLKIHIKHKYVNTWINDPSNNCTLKPYNLEYFKMLLGHGYNINNKNKAGRTILHYIFSRDCITEFDLECATFCVNNGARVGVTDKEGLTPLLLFCSRSVVTPYAEPILRLLSGEYNARLLSATDVLGQNFLIKCIISKNVHLIDYVPEYANICDWGSTDYAGKNILHHACENIVSVDAFVQFFVRAKAAGISINDTTNDGETVLVSAMQRNNDELVQKIIELGGIAKPCPQMAKLLPTCIKNKRWDYIRMLEYDVDCLVGLDAVTNTVQHCDDYKILEKVLEANANIGLNITEIFINYLVMPNCDQQKIDLLSKYIHGKNYPRIDSRHHHAGTILTTVTVIKHLLERGFRMHFSLKTIIERASKETINFLLDNIDNPQITIDIVYDNAEILFLLQNPDSLCSLIDARCIDIKQILHKHEFDVDIVDKILSQCDNISNADIKQILRHAILHKFNVDVVDKILSKCENINFIYEKNDHRGTRIVNTPLSLAIEYGALDLIELFIRCGADIFYESTDIYAKLKGRPDREYILELFVSAQISASAGAATKNARSDMTQK